MGSPKVQAPKPTAEERALQAEQTELLRSQREILLQQQQQQAALLPIFAKQLGLQLEIDPETGQIKGGTELPGAAKQREMQEKLMELTLADLIGTPEGRAQAEALKKQQSELLGLQLAQQKEEMTGPEALRRKEIEGLLNERTLKALRGELEVDPALERDIREQRETLQERLRQQLGAGFETSTPGTEALNRFEESATILRDQARRGQLTLSEQLSLARQGADIAQGGSGMAATQTRIPGIDPLSAGGFAFGTSQGAMQNQGTLRQVLASPLGVAGGLGQVAAGFQMPIGTMQQNRQMELNASIVNAQNSMSMMGGIGSLFGSIFGALPFMSDEYNKNVLAKVSETPDGVGIYIWQREGEEAKLGVLAQDVLLHRPHAVVEGDDGIYRVHRDAL